MMHGAYYGVNLVIKSVSRKDCCLACQKTKRLARLITRESICKTIRDITVSSFNVVTCWDFGSMPSPYWPLPYGTQFLKSGKPLILLAFWTALKNWLFRHM